MQTKRHHKILFQDLICDMLLQWGNVAFLMAGLLLFPISLFAQHNNHGFTFSHLTVDEGLSHTTVHSILEDQRGLIWIGTRFGLNRFDGYSFRQYFPDSTHSRSIGDHVIFSLLEDQKGDIWIGHQNRGMSIYSPRTDDFQRFFPAQKGEPSIDWETISVRSLFQDSRGNIWIGTYGAGAVVLNAERQIIMQLCSYCEGRSRQLANDFVFDFAEDREGKIWIGTAGKGLGVYDPIQDAVRKVEGRPQDQIDGFGRELCLDKNGDLWIGTSGNGIFQMKLPEEKIVAQFQSSDEKGLQNDLITDLALSRKGALWAATDGGGLHIYDPTSESWQQFHYSASHPGTLNTDALYDLMFDRHDNLWVASFNGGVNLHRAVPSSFASNRNYTREQLMGLRSVLALSEDQNGAVWMGTDGVGLFRLAYHGADLEVEPIPIGENKTQIDVITSIATTPDGHLWLGTYGKGLFYLDQQQVVQQHFLHEPGQSGSLSHNNVWDLAVDSLGGLWVGTLGGGLNYLPPGQKNFLRYEARESAGPTSLSSVMILDILLNKDGEKLWIATEDAGLDCLDLHSQSISHYSSKAGKLSGDRLRCLFEDEEGMIWVGTEYAGLNRINPANGEIVSYRQADGLPSDMINGIVQGPEGHLWISTQGGISRWDQMAHRFVHIGSDPYLKNNEFNPKAALRIKNGHLVFGSTNGYAVVVPERLADDQAPPEVILTDLSISNQLIPIGEHQGRSILDRPLNDSTSVVQLSYKDRGIAFSLASSQATEASRQGYAYRLIPYEKQWRHLRPGEHIVSYSGLPAGDYRLEVRIVDPAGNLGRIRQLRIQVEPPFWQSRWFYGVSCLALLLLLAAILAFLLQRQRAYYRTRAIESEREILRLHNESLEKDVASQRARLSASVLQAAHKNEMLNGLKSKITELLKDQAQTSGVKKLMREIDRELKQEDYWQQFQMVFDQTHTRFIRQTEQLYPSLTDHEKRLCCFIRMQLSNREIATILNITTNGVEQAKYRIKKKMQLDKTVVLNDHIRAL
ncbi:MAG: two-component regulator propeller domain-containing protein [Bacteroidota bacterium]